MGKRVTQEIDPWDVGPAEALAIGVGCDTGAQKAEMANSKLLTTFQPGQEPTPLFVKEQ